MSYEIRADYSQSWLFPPHLEDWVPVDHPARFLREFVDTLDVVGIRFSPRTNEDGRPNYAADLLLRVWLYGYVNGIRSLRKLERACRERRVDVAGRAPRPRSQHAVAVLARQPSGAAEDVQTGSAGGDAGPARRRGAARRRWHQGVRAGAEDRVRKREQVEEALAHVDEAVEEVMAQIEAAAEQEHGPGYELPAGWREQMLRREQLRELVEELHHNERQTIHELEREARFMKTRREGTALAYNAQTVVESGGLIVAEAVVTEETDHQQLVPMLEQVNETLGTVAAETVADAGYHSGEQLQQAEQRQYGVVVGEQRQPGGKAGANPDYDSSRFVYDEFAATQRQ